MLFGWFGKLMVRMAVGLLSPLSRVQTHTGRRRLKIACFNCVFFVIYTYTYMILPVLTRFSIFFFRFLSLFFSARTYRSVISAIKFYCYFIIYTITLSHTSNNVVIVVHCIRSPLYAHRVQTVKTIKHTGLLFCVFLRK